MAGAPRFDPTDPAFLHDPYPTYARLRRETPLLWHEPWGRWIVTRYRDVDRLLRDRRLGRVDHHRLPPASRPPANPEHAPFDAVQRGSLLEIEPPDHTRVRAVVHEAFTPRHVRALRERVERLVAELVDGLEARPEREADLLRDFAEPLPVTVIADLLGVPEGARDRLLPWSKAIIGMFEPERTPAMEAAAVRAADEFASYLRTLLPEKRAAGTDDLLGRMAREHDRDPQRLSEDELIANAVLFLNAGHEAVVNVIGNGVRALLSHPAELSRLRREPALLGSAVEEMMRYDTPLQFFERVLFEEVEVAGRRLPAGARVCLYYASANRDPEVFDAPDRFDVGRDPNPHLAFGRGLHFCIGAPLARLELACALEALLERLPDLALLSREARYQPRNVFRYQTELRVRY